MSQERLTRQELSWLLAQEARGAARAIGLRLARRGFVVQSGLAHGRPLYATHPGWEILTPRFVRKVSKI